MIAAIHFFMATIWTGHPSLGGGRFKPCKINSSFEYGWLKETKVPAFVRPKLMAQSLGGEHGVVMIKTIMKASAISPVVGGYALDFPSKKVKTAPVHWEEFIALVTRRFFFCGLFHGGQQKMGMVFWIGMSMGKGGSLKGHMMIFFFL